MPQPIDAQSELARLSLLDRAQEVAGRAAAAQAQRDLAEAERLRNQDIRTVQETPESQSEHVDEDGRRKNPFVVRRRKRKGGEDATDLRARVFYDAKERTRVADDPDGQELDVTV